MRYSSKIQPKGISLIKKESTEKEEEMRERHRIKGVGEGEDK